MYLSWSTWKVLGLFFLCLRLDATRDEYSRTSSYAGEMVLRCPDKRKPVVQILQEYSDVLGYGEESVDLRIARKTFARVQHYYPDCYILVQDLEATVQEAEAQMFPKKTREQEQWMKMVIQSVLPDSDSKAQEQEEDMWDQAMQDSSMWFREYHNYNNTIRFYQNLATQHPDLVKFIPTIGQSTEGRNMPCVHITASKNKNVKKFYIQCLIHAREWISGSTCMYIAKHLVKDYKVSSKVTAILDALEIVMVPIVNPDGYVYTWESDRMWRKNRKKRAASQCVGVDLNRNFPDGFKQTTNYCAADYGGPEAVSEVETKHIINNFRANSPIIGSLDFHSYGQLILRPYGKTKTSSAHEVLHKRIGNEMASLIKDVHGKTYVSQKSIDLYPCYGIAADWLYSDDAARTNNGYRSASFCIELRGTSVKIGFLLPAEEIIPTGEEVYPAVVHYMKTMLDHPIQYSSPSQSSAFSTLDSERGTQRDSRY